MASVEVGTEASRGIASRSDGMHGVQISVRRWSRSDVGSVENGVDGMAMRFTPLWLLGGRTFLWAPWCWLPSGSLVPLEYQES